MKARQSLAPPIAPPDHQALNIPSLFNGPSNSYLPQNILFSTKSPDLCYFNIPSDVNAYAVLYAIIQLCNLMKPKDIFSAYIQPLNESQIFVETANESSLKSLLSRIDVFQDRLPSISFLKTKNELVTKFCSPLRMLPLKPGYLVKVHHKVYSKDVAQVVDFIPDKGKVLLKLIPRIDYHLLKNYNLTSQAKLYNYIPNYNESEIPQNSFNPDFAPTKPVKIFVSWAPGGVVDALEWDGEKFVGKFLYKIFRLDEILINQKFKKKDQKPFITEKNQFEKNNKKFMTQFELDDEIDYKTLANNTLSVNLEPPPQEAPAIQLMRMFEMGSQNSQESSLPTDTTTTSTKSSSISPSNSLINSSNSHSNSNNSDLSSLFRQTTSSSNSNSLFLDDSLLNNNSNNNQDNQIKTYGVSPISFHESISRLNKQTSNNNTNNSLIDTLNLDNLSFPSNSHSTNNNSPINRSASPVQSPSNRTNSTTTTTINNLVYPSSPVYLNTTGFNIGETVYLNPKKAHSLTISSITQNIISGTINTTVDQISRNKITSSLSNHQPVNTRNYEIVHHNIVTLIEHLCVSLYDSTRLLDLICFKTSHEVAVVLDKQFPKLKCITTKNDIICPDITSTEATFDYIYDNNKGVDASEQRVVQGDKVIVNETPSYQGLVCHTYNDMLFIESSEKGYLWVEASNVVAKNNTNTNDSNPPLSSTTPHHSTSKQILASPAPTAPHPQPGQSSATDVVRGDAQKRSTAPASTKEKTTINPQNPALIDSIKLPNKNDKNVNNWPKLEPTLPKKSKILSELPQPTSTSKAQSTPIHGTNITTKPTTINQSNVISESLLLNPPQPGYNPPKRRGNTTIVPTSPIVTLPSRPIEQDPSSFSNHINDQKSPNSPPTNHPSSSKADHESNPHRKTEGKKHTNKPHNRHVMHHDSGYDYDHYNKYSEHHKEEIDRKRGNEENQGKGKMKEVENMKEIEKNRDRDREKERGREKERDIYGRRAPDIDEYYDEYYDDYYHHRSNSHYHHHGRDYRDRYRRHSPEYTKTSSKPVYEVSKSMHRGHIYH
ncbi:hypothetical protein TRFO_01045 [Tritrichomonas foetus]|uniref:Uncharacterized protein n=1 Tax=Tritrichomonas foetus TaxID=1144522 RepID=A0A1J4KN72_9EUKA|nr:hypothetical protein TRFO_01045 [Tritrichomonas foetus]|eukprot:OHT11150.1 hypothetical protein TRFO_01045 [Tritrichomonas foetus]